MSAEAGDTCRYILNRAAMRLKILIVINRAITIFYRDYL